nr:eukaryotic translation initiation factor 5A-2 [Ipomoea trifida]
MWQKLSSDVLHVSRVDYQLIDVSEDEFVSLLIEYGNSKDDLGLPTNEALFIHINKGFDEWQDLVVYVISTMGEEQIYALKDIGQKN